MDVLNEVFGIYRNEARVVRDIMQSAMLILMDMYESDFKIYEKGKKDWVTDADLACHRYITETLKLHFEDDTIISEEDEDHLKKSAKGRMWLIDPLDGTRDFMEKNGEFAIHMGLVENGKCVFGAVGIPVLSKIYLGAPGLGSVRVSASGAVLIKRLPESVPDNLTLLTSRFHADFDSTALRETVGLKNVKQHGSFGYKTMLIVEDEGHFFVYKGGGTKEWDSCAPEAVIKGAGGQITDMDGDPLVYGKETYKNANGVMVSRGIYHQDILSKLQLCLK